MKKKNEVKNITLRGKKFSLKRVSKLDVAGNFEGDCSPPDQPNRRIRVLSKIKDEPELDVLIHEMLHACLWDIDEGAINESATDIAKALWRIGYRKIKE